MESGQFTNVTKKKAVHNQILPTKTAPIATQNPFQILNKEDDSEVDINGERRENPSKLRR